MADLVISLIQADLTWEDRKKNLSYFKEKIHSLQDGSDIVMLPEMFTTGFTMNAENVAETMDGESVNWMREMAERTGKVMVGSFVCLDNDKYFNRFIWMRPDGSFEKYDKKHLFRMANEDDHYAAGNDRLVVEHKGWKIRPLVCYDLRFPVWSRNRHRIENGKAIPDYDVLLYVANWPEARTSAWDILLRARAVENQVYCLGVNRVGTDGKGIEYSGHSAAIDPKGNYLLAPVHKNEGVYTVTLNRTELDDFREKFPQGLDADAFQLADDV